MLAFILKCIFLLIGIDDALTTLSYTTASPAPSSITCNDPTGCEITCNGDNVCESITIDAPSASYLTITSSGSYVLSKSVVNCPSNALCTITAIGSRAMDSITINCGTDGVCDITGGGDYSMYYGTINAPDSTKLTTTADGGFWSLCVWLLCPRGKPAPSCIIRMRSDSSPYWSPTLGGPIMIDTWIYSNNINDVEFRCDAISNWDALFHVTADDGDLNNIYRYGQPQGKEECEGILLDSFDSSDFFNTNVLTCAQGKDPTLLNGKRCVSWVTGSPTSEPTAAPTQPTSIPSPSPTKSPSDATLMPTASPTKSPSKSPTASPTSETLFPSVTPTRFPTKSPTNIPTLSPTNPPTATPTDTTGYPTAPPTLIPSNPPSQTPSDAPTRSPTLVPSHLPTKSSSKSPSHLPTKSPSKSPTNPPSKSPTEVPTMNPSNVPTRYPSKPPIKIPTTTPTTAEPSASTQVTMYRSTKQQRQKAEDNYTTANPNLVLPIVVSVALVIIIAVLVCVLVWFLRDQKKEEREITEMVSAPVAMPAEKETPMPTITREPRSSLDEGAGEEADDSLGCDIPLPAPKYDHERMVSDSLDNEVMKVTDGQIPDTNLCTNCEEYKTGKIFGDDGLFYCTECYERWDVRSKPRDHGAQEHETAGAPELPPKETQLSDGTIGSDEQALNDGTDSETDDNSMYEVCQTQQ